MGKKITWKNHITWIRGKATAIRFERQDMWVRLRDTKESAWKEVGCLFLNYSRKAVDSSFGRSKYLSWLSSRYKTSFFLFMLTELFPHIHSLLFGLPHWTSSSASQLLPGETEVPVWPWTEALACLGLYDWRRWERPWSLQTELGLWERWPKGPRLTQEGSPVQWRKRAINSEYLLAKHTLDSYLSLMRSSRTIRKNWEDSRVGSSVRIQRTDRRALGPPYWNFMQS